MPELVSSERLQPSLLDRLEDDEPRKTVESRDKRVISMQRLHASVRRDLAWLLNTTNLESVQDLSAYPETRNSVLNFGVPDLSGKMIGGPETPEVQRTLKAAVLAFEPRILANSLEINVQIEDRAMSRRRMTLEVRGDLWAHPLPIELLFRTEVDLETGDVTPLSRF